MRSPKAVLASFFIFFLFLAVSVSAQSEGADASSAEGPGRPWLGVTIQDMNEETAKSMGLEQTDGVLVSNVIEGGPAEGAGINMGDVILRLNGQEVRNSEEFISKIQSTGPGSMVALDVNKGGSIESVNVELGRMPAAAMRGMGGQMAAQGMGCGMQQGGSAPGCPMGDACPMKEACPGMGGAACPECPMGEGCPTMKGGMGSHGHGMMKGPMMWDGGMGGMMGGSNYGKMYMKAIRALNLTPDQKAKAQALHSDYHKKTIRAMADIKIAEIELRDIMSADPASLEKVRVKINEISAKKADLRFSRIKALDEFKKILTPEQKKQLKDISPMGGGMMMGMGGMDEMDEAASE